MSLEILTSANRHYRTNLLSGELYLLSMNTELWIDYIFDLQKRLQMKMI